MTRQNPLVGRPRTAPQQSWTRWTEGPNGEAIFVDPAPGHTYVRGAGWPFKGQGQGESLYSPRRVKAKLRAVEVIRLRIEGYTWAVIARRLGFADASGAYRAFKRTEDRVLWDQRQREKLKERRRRAD